MKEFSTNNCKESKVLWTPEQISEIRSDPNAGFGIGMLQGMFYLYPNSYVIKESGFEDLDDILITPTPYNRGYDHPFAPVTPTLCDDFIHLTKQVFEHPRPTDTPISLIIHDIDEGRCFVICTISWQIITEKCRPRFKNQIINPNNIGIDQYLPVVNYSNSESMYLLTENMYKKMLTAFVMIKHHLLQYEYWQDPKNYTPSYDDVYVDEIVDLE